MYIDEFREYCLAKPAVTENFPFNETTLVFKVGGKMFALTNVDTFESVNLKCDPETAIELREKYAAVKPGYHMNKKHWNTIVMDGSIPDQQLYYWTDLSYDLVYNGLPARIRESIQK